MHVTARLSATNVLARCAVLRRERRLRAVRTSSGPRRPNVAPQAKFALGFQSLRPEMSHWGVHRHHLPFRGSVAVELLDRALSAEGGYPQILLRWSGFPD